MSLQWLLGGSEDPWFFVPAFRRVGIYRCYSVSIVQTRSDGLTVNLNGRYSGPGKARFGWRTFRIKAGLSSNFPAPIQGCWWAIVGGEVVDPVASQWADSG